MYRFHFFLLTLLTTLTHGQNLDRLGTPYVKNYNTHEMGFDKKTWNITQNEEGILYFANGRNILEYDGERWNKIQTPLKQVNRCLFSVTKDSMFIGMDGDYGVLKRSDTGDFNFDSLFSFNKENTGTIEEFWKIHKYKGYHIFQTFRNLYVYDGSLTTKIPAPYRFKWSTMVDKDFYVNDVKYGLFKFSGTNLMPILNEPLINDKIIGVTEMQDQLMVITNTEGLYFVKNGKLEKWDFPETSEIAKAQIFSFLKLRNGDLALGTVSNGVYILDNNGTVKIHLNKRTGLQNNTVLTIFEDVERNLWLGLDFGVDYVKVNSNLTYTFDYLGDFGSTYAAARYKNQLYLGTNQGFYNVHNTGDRTSLTFGSLLSGQVWNLEQLDDLLWVGHDTGAFTFDGTNLIHVGKEPGAWNFKKVNKTTIVSGNYDGISIYKKSSETNKWVFHKKITGYSDSGRFIAIDTQEHVWVSLNTDGVHKLKVNFESGEIVDQAFFPIKDLGVERVSVARIDDHIVVTGSGKAQVYDKTKNSFVPYSKMDKIPKFTSSLQKLRDQTWFLSNADISRSSKGTYQYLEDLQGRLVFDVLNVFPLDNTKVLIPIYNGFAIYTETSEPTGSEIPKTLLIRKIRSINNSNQYSRHDIIDHDDNDINITYAQPTFGHHILYQTSLNDEEWSAWDTAANTTLLNLNEGEYVFKVRAKSENKISEDEITFVVNPPLHRSTMAYILYALGILLLITCFILWNRYRLKKQEQKLLERKRISLKEQEQRFQIEQQEQQKRIVELENTRLQEEVQNKSRELTQVAHVNMNKNKILKKIKEKLAEVQDKASEKLAYPSYNELKRYIEYYITDKENELFTINFDKSHQDFYSNISEKYPSLTPKDLRLCAYLRINLSSKEIAPLLGISSQSVDVSRHRLRKKMNLDTKENLTAVLASFS